MTAGTLPRFDIAALKRLAEAPSLAARPTIETGASSILAVEPRRVLAQVAGTEDYCVNLLGGGETIDGACTCGSF